MANKEFTVFCMSAADQAFLKQYVSPKYETSLFKNIPISELDRVKAMLRPLGNLRMVYRGPRSRYSDQGMTWKCDAERFSVYRRHL